MSNCAFLKEHTQCVLGDKLFCEEERISPLIKVLFFFFDVQHIIKSAPIVMLPNQPPRSLPLRGQILRQAVGQLVCVIQRLRNNRGEIESTPPPLLLLLLLLSASVREAGCVGGAAATK